ncbi:zinc ribbon domain-containing protein [Ruminococcus sp. zg-924]|uniref:zinc ribbon domain-containing protein n=1 Tax=Ruminococcus sp. zg-924 TaxID=2678505 RepID=UPI00210A9B3A|nr:zinc ribbon domain-containing protein [Ruminococcus sp. zg-924]MCQ4022807.1 zinc-ribbon domain-containing protein [Ruminococcus sp. zg-924]
MKCPKCGKEIDDGSKFCVLCGSRITEKTDSNTKAPKKKKKHLIPLFVTIALVAVLGTVGLVCSGVFNKEKTESEIVQQGFEDYFDVKNYVSELTSGYKNSEGYIEKHNINGSVLAVGAYAKELYENKKIKDYEITEGKSVWIQFNSGVEYIYIPLVEGIDSSTISTYQPCLTMYPSDLQELGSKCVDGAASKVQSVLNEYSFENNYDNETITLDLLKSIGPNEIVIWHGHGGYNTKTHSVLLTGLKLDEEKFLLDPIYYIQNLGYTNDYLTGRILCSDSGYVMVSYKFFEKYLENLDSSIIYLGACDSGKDDILVNTFVTKGAKAVIGNTEEIPTEYNLKMISSVFDELVTVSDKKYQDIQTALEKAKDTNADVYEETGCIANVRIWGDDSTRLSDEKINTEYKAEDLIDKSLPEIVDIMGGDFEVEYGGDKLVYYTSPTIIMYNDKTLPGFAFYIDDAVMDYENGLNIKEKIKSGSYKNYSFLALLDNAKLTDKIKANMTYNELTTSLGEFDCGGIAGGNDYSYYTDTLGSQTIYLFKADNTLLSSYDGGNIKKDWLKEHNPKLHAIIVYPTTSNNSQQEDISAEEENNNNDDWKQLYTDMIANDIDPTSFSLIKIDNDDIPELIFTGSAVGGTRMAWVKDGKLEIQGIGYGEVRYYEKQGWFYCQYINHGIFTDSVYKMENNSLSTLFQGTILPEENGFDNPGWFIDNESVDEDYYKAKLNNAFDFSNSKTMDQYYSRSEIIDAINNF